MPLRTQYPTLISVIVLVGALIFAVGCDNPVEDDDGGHDHAEVEGLILLTDAGELLRVEEGVTNDTLWVPLDAATDEIEIGFIDHDGEEIHIEDLEEDFELGWTVGDTDILGFEQDGNWSFTLEGLAADTTTLSIQLLHLPQRHEDFTTPDIPVVVR